MFRRIHLQCHVETGTTAPLIPVCFPVFCVQAYFQQIIEKVKTSGAEVIKLKGATYYGIGMSLVRITKAIFGDENSVITVSSRLNGEYGMRDVYLGLPAYINRNGVRKILPLNLRDEEIEKLRNSYNILKESYESLNL